MLGLSDLQMYYVQQIIGKLIFELVLSPITVIGFPTGLWNICMVIFECWLVANQNDDQESPTNLFLNSIPIKAVLHEQKKIKDWGYLG